MSRFVPSVVHLNEANLSDDESLGEANIQLTSPILAPHPPPISPLSTSPRPPLSPLPPPPPPARSYLATSSPNNYIALINPPPAAIPIPTMPQRINSLTQV
ncbi:hypothetical protein EYB25_007516 [Talaromyces marneffei]|nr:hypothetical protein EYB25_007516 [Talaromyces marneffei]